MCFDVKKMLGLDDIASEVEHIKQDIRKTLVRDSSETHTFTVQKPFCCPAGPLVRKALEPYGVKILALGDDKCVNISITNFAQMAKIERKRMENIRYGPMAVMWLPYAMTMTVTVRKAQAEWAEYLLERTLQMCVVKGQINSKNRDWANQHNGQMPKPWIEKRCNEGNNIWTQVNAIMEAEKDVQRKRK